MRIAIPLAYLAFFASLGGVSMLTQGKERRFPDNSAPLQARIEVVITREDAPEVIIAQDSLVVLLDQGREVGHPFAYGRMQAVKEIPYLVRCAQGSGVDSQQVRKASRKNPDIDPTLCEHGHIETRLSGEAYYFQQSPKSPRKGHLELFVHQQRHIHVLLHGGSIAKAQEAVFGEGKFDVVEGAQTLAMTPFKARVMVVFSPADIAVYPAR